MKIYPHLNDIPKTEWQRLFDLIPAIENTRSFGTIKGGQKQPNGYIEMPYISQSELVRGFLKLVYDIRIILDFDWPAWDEGREFIMKKDFTNLDIETYCKLLTAIVRSDRFNEGYLAENFENGNVLNILKNLKKVVEQINN
jgi:hypothetical protein